MHIYIYIYNLMIGQIIITLIIIILIILIIILYAYLKIDKHNITNKQYYEITLFLGSGGHTGQLCSLLNNFHIQKVNKLNIVISATDKSSQAFFKKYLEDKYTKNYMEIMKKINFYYILRARQVKQSKFTLIFTLIRSIISSLCLVIQKLMNTTHFIANGPGTCVPLYYIYYLIKILRLSRVKLIFFESWCRVQNLSLTGKIVRPIVSQFIVHWPELAAKYKNCKYFPRMI